MCQKLCYITRITIYTWSLTDLGLIKLNRLKSLIVLAIQCALTPAMSEGLKFALLWKERYFVILYFWSWSNWIISSTCIKPTRKSVEMIKTAIIDTFVVAGTDKCISSHIRNHFNSITAVEGFWASRLNPRSSFKSCFSNILAICCL